MPLEYQLQEFKTERLVEKSVSLHAKISHIYISDNPEISRAKKKIKKALVTSDDAENSQASRYIQFATSRGIELGYLLSDSILSRPVFLLEKNQLYLKKPNKGDLSRALLSSIDNERISVGENGSVPSLKSNAIMIDFMSVVRRITSVQLKDVTEFGHLVDLLLKVCLKYGHQFTMTRFTLSWKTTKMIVPNHPREKDVQGSSPIHVMLFRIVKRSPRT